MAKQWLVGLVGAFAVICLAGVGFSAFTASATVNGQASAATMDLKIYATEIGSCSSIPAGIPVPGAGNVTFSNLNAAETSVTLSVSNLTPNVYCLAYVWLQNAGSVPVNLSVAINTPGVDGMCTGGAVNCFDVFTYSGLDLTGAPYGYWFLASPNLGTPTYSQTNVITLNPSAVYGDIIGVDIPSTSGDSTPGSAVFSIVYTASAGL